MKEVEKLARLLIAYGGLELLTRDYKNDPNVKVTRNHLFAVPRDTPHNPHLEKAIRTKPWQRDYIQRLIDTGYLVKIIENSQEFYKPVNISKIIAVIADFDNKGLILAKFVFPREAGSPKELIDKEEAAEEEENDEDDVGLDIEDEDQIETVTSDTPVALEIKGSAENIANLVKFMRAVDGRFQDITDGIQLIKGLSEGIGKAVIALRSHDRPSAQAEKDFQGYIKNRFTDIEQRLQRIEETAKFTAQNSVNAGVKASAFAQLHDDVVDDVKLYIHQTVMSVLSNVNQGVYEIWVRLQKKTQTKDVLLEFQHMRTEIKDGLQRVFENVDAVGELALKVVEDVEKGEGDGS